MLNADYVLNKYYTDVTSKEFPGYTVNQLSEELLPAGYEDYIVLGVYSAKYADAYFISDNGYDIVYSVASTSTDDEFIGVVIGNRLMDITQELSELVEEYEGESEEDWSEDAMIEYGKQLYSAYGPDVDTYDMSEYEAECYLAYVATL